MYAAALLAHCDTGHPTTAAAARAPHHDDPPERASTATAVTAEPATTPAETKPGTAPEVGANAESNAAVLTLGPERSTSRGGPMDGLLEGGVTLPSAGPGYIGNPRRSAESRYGTVELVQALVRAAADSQLGDEALPLVINDLSLSAGGPIPQHSSHQSGRDVDILFFLEDLSGKPVPSLGVPLSPDGTGVDFRDLADPRDDVAVRINLARTWRFIAALIARAGDDLQRIFIVEHLRSLLLAEAKRQHATADLQIRFAMLACQPGTPHDDHMHVRFHCSLDDLRAGCLDTPPVYPFRQQQLALAGLEPQLAPRTSAAQKKAAAGRTTTTEQARKAAGPMHADVVAFLDARKAWLKKRTPPRPYCK